MADISKCCNTKCPSREECYRYRCRPSQFMQAYNDYKPKEGQDRCESFDPLDGWDENWLIPEGALIKNIFEGKKNG